MRFRLGLVVLAIVLAGCTDDNGGTIVGATSPSLPLTSTTAAGASTTTSSAVEGAGTDLADGEHVAVAKDADGGARTITVDVVQFLTGEAAAEAYRQETGETGGPPNDVWVVNENPKLRTLPVAPNAQVTLVKLAEDSDADSDPATFDELVTYVASFGDDADAGPFLRLQVRGGVITRIDEQYTP